MKLRITAMALVLLIPALAVSATEEDVVDFSDQITPTCELIGLVGLPPEGWFNVPIERPMEGFQGCQMMRTGEQDELLGILRLSSRIFPADTPEEEWYSQLVGLEVAWLEEMGITLGEPMWRREDVPMTGTGWEPGKAIGLEATIEGNDIPQEVHLLTFGGSTTKYLITLSTPAKEVEKGIYYERNTSDMGVLMRTLQFPKND